MATIVANASTRKHGLKVVTKSHGTFYLPYRPQGMDSTGNNVNYATFERPGRKPLLIAASPAVPTYSFTLQLVTDGNRSVNDLVEKLKLVAGTGDYVWFAIQGVGWGTITQLDFSDKKLNALHHRTWVEATVTVMPLQMIRAWPVSLPKAKKPAKKKTPSKPKTPSKVKTYRVKKGDTLSGISQKIYHTTSKWHELAKLNRIRDPRQLKVGQVLRLP